MASQTLCRLEEKCSIAQRVDYGVCRIAFSGRMGSGKSTLAQKIIETYPDVDFKVLSFASGVREVARNVFGMKTKNRELLIQIGNKMREIDPDVWAKRVIREADNHPFCLVDDLRYPNEAKYLQEAGFTLVRLDISLDTQQKRLQNTYPDTWKSHLEYQHHFTEEGLDDSLFEVSIPSE